MTLRHTLRALAALALLLSPAVGAQDLIITGAYDGSLSGGTPKGVELYATGDIADLSLYGFGSANNGDGTDGAEFILSGSASEGDFLYIATEADNFTAFFGFAPTFTDGSAAINGDDAVELFYDAGGDPANGVVIDVFGDRDVDGSGMPWDYLDGWAYRVNGTGPDGTDFVLGNFTYGGVDALEGGTDNASATSPFPIGTYMADMADGATVAFSVATGTVDEGGTTAVDVVLSITGTAPTGDIVVDITPTDNADASADVTTLTFTSPMDGDSQTVTFTATDDDEAEVDEVVSFALAVTSGDATVGAPGAFALTITDNDTAQMVTLAEARAAGPGTLVMVTGTVTRSMGAFTYLQDATGGLTVRQTGGPFRDAVDDGTIAPGVELTLTGTLSEFNSLLQINGGDLQDYTVGAAGMVPDPIVLGLDEIAENGELYEGRLVTVFGVTLDEDGDTVFQAGTNYDITDISDSSNAVELRVVGANDTMIDGTAIPPDPITITGVVGQFSSDDPAAGYQILPIQRMDVAGTPGAPVLVQVIHNAPDPGAAVVDVYVNGDLALDDLEFQTGTPFIELPSNVALDLAVAPGSSASVDDAVFTTSVALAEGEAYQVVAQGVLDPSMFAANPDGVSTAFTLALNAGAKTTADEFPFNTEINFFHGTPDAPVVDIRRGATQSVILFNDVTYGDFSEMYEPAPPQLSRFEVTTADGVTVFGRAELDLGGRGGEAGILLASGFADPAANQDGAPLSLLIVFADGTSQVAPVVVFVAGEDDSDALELSLGTPSPNPAVGASRVAYTMPEAGAVTLSVYDALGRRVAVLVDGEVAADRHEATLDARALAAGVYVVRLQTEAGTMQKTFTVVR